MGTFSLSRAQARHLERVFKTSQDRRLRDRCQAILLRADGYTRAEVARMLHVSPRSVQRWAKLYRTGGLHALRICWGPGRPPKLKPDSAALLRRWVRRGPA